MKQLEESGIKDSLMKALEKNPCADIAEILEYEISKNENLEDAFLSDAHELAMDCVCVFRHYAGIFDQKYSES